MGNKINICRHEIDPDSLEYSKRYGRIGKCKLCGCKIRQTKYVNINKPKIPKMNKKERKKVKKAMARYGDIPESNIKE
jgi:hypothetical protein